MHNLQHTPPHAGARTHTRVHPHTHPGLRHAGARACTRGARIRPACTHTHARVRGRKKYPYKGN